MPTYGVNGPERDNCSVKITHHYDELTQYTRPILTWVGNPKGRLFLGDEVAKRFAPWPLEEVERNEWMRGAWYIRVDQHGAWYRKWYYRLTFKASWWYGWWKDRTILTFHIWGMGEYHAGSIPQWSDVSFLKWTKKKEKSR